MAGELINYLLIGANLPITRNRMSNHAATRSIRDSHTESLNDSRYAPLTRICQDVGLVYATIDPIYRHTPVKGAFLSDPFFPKPYLGSKGLVDLILSQTQTAPSRGLAELSPGSLSTTMGLADFLGIQPTPWYEIDVLPVGKAGRSGDAIAMRYVLPGYNRPCIMVIDGGDKDAGAQIVDHVRRHYGVGYVDHVVNTHPDADHSSGLTEIIENLSVGCLWMHKPWEHAAAIVDQFHDGRLTPNSVHRRVQEALSSAKAVHDLAVRYGITIIEPFQGAQIGAFRVMSPSYVDYLSLLQHFRATPPATTPSPLQHTGVAALIDAALNWVPATPSNENLMLGLNPTAAENETSVVLYGDFGSERILLTGDAGPAALSSAIRYAHSIGASLLGLRLLQVPHHGSRNNITSEILQYITATSAFVSVAPLSPTHPRRCVTNALTRRGQPSMPHRAAAFTFPSTGQCDRGWQLIDAIPFHHMIEAA